VSVCVVVLTGLGSILFAISFERAELNASKPAARRSAQLVATLSADDACPVASDSPNCM